MRAQKLLEEFKDAPLREVFVVVAAGGRGRRFKQKDKLLQRLGSSSVIERSIQVFVSCPQVTGVILVSPPQKTALFKNMAKRFSKKKAVLVAAGGRHRQDSVWKGLQALGNIPQNSLILVHDGARPFVSRKLVQALIFSANRWGAAIPAVPVKDTVKESDSERRVHKTLSREVLLQAQTPQAFRWGILQKAYLKALRTKRYATDCSTLVEEAGYPVKIVPGDERNIKITTYQDLKFARFLQCDGDPYRHRI